MDGKVVVVAGDVCYVDDNVTVVNNIIMAILLVLGDILEPVRLRDQRVLFD